MSTSLQQLEAATNTAVRKADAAVRNAGLKANYALLLALVLIIIPTLSGVALIA